MTPKVRALSGCPATAGSPSEDSGLLGVSRTPGHNAVHHPAHSNGSAACRSTQHRQRGLSTPHSNDTSVVEATPNAGRQRPSRVARATLLASPLYAPSNGVGAAADTRTSGVQDDNGSGSQLPSQSSLLCTPNGACRSAAVAAAAASGTRSRLDTPTRLDEIPLFFNNSFESGFESPPGDAAAGGGYSATQMTPYRTYDLQMAVEEVLRSCLDSFTPAKCSDTSGATPHGSRRRAQAAPFNAYAALESLLPPSAMGSAGQDGSEVWAPAMMGAAMPGSTPERVTAPQGAFAESDDEGALTTPQSDRASCGMPYAGVRRDPMAYLSTAAVMAADSSEGRCGVTHHGEGGVESIGSLSAGCGACGGATESLPPHSSDARSGLEFNCRNGHCGGPDMLAMLAAAVQQQHPQHPHSYPHTETRPQSARSTTGSMELDSRAFSERDVAAAAEQQSTSPPPSYEVAACHQKPPHHGSYAHPDLSSAPSCAAATHAQPPTRRGHHLPHVKAAAGSLIAVGGRRVPVDKLHLLSIGDEPSLSAPSSMAGQAVTAASSRGGSKARSQQSSSSAPYHVEGPSMRRVPKANLVTVTHAAAAGLVEAGAPAPPGRHASAPVHERDAALPTSSSSATLSEAAPARAAAAGPSARRVPPAMATQQRHSSGSIVPAVVALNSAVDREGVQQSSEADVVAVLQFPKGQTMRFLTNLSSAALATAKDAVARDLTNSKRSTGGTATSVLASRSLLRCVEVGKTYLAHVYAEGSPHEGVSYEDAGVCVQLITPSSSLYAALLGCVNGVLLRKVDVLVNDEDRKQHERLLLQQTTAYIECERHFKFSGLPFQLESIYCTFDGSVCVVFYRLLPVADGSASSFASHRHPSTSRMVRELKFHLNCRVFLKRCLHRTHTYTQKK
ncbi:conserved hypothetical protein [Leishmania major strain Friedlin]|uniref:PSP1 C-terminal domain-containing protein n=1 Tax=Leishmania major TaxID=5664 RepID=Q4Q7G7_LEIMA|nr:conserved hypothetical protein [Leishmania major strain Friedlin]CAG9578333.1 PSP1_C-terminal_conserved_region_containing_protein_-_putative [Leishmania major strain Friedlin]CAJ06216.1 conserved hypothetical protein [Leishmania major strain Friedlin]|eukprot:XP_001684731.1 conserved hypothetical protein [Leishmania major strain Friedlin]